MDALGVACQDVGGTQVDEIGSRTLHGAADVAVGDDAFDAVAFADDDQSQSATADRVDHILGRAVGADDGQVVAAHDVADRSQQPASQTAARVEPCEVVARKVAHLHQGDGHRIAHGDLRRGRGRGREVQDAGLVVDRDVEVDVRVDGERGGRIARHRDQPVAVVVDEGDDFEYFVRFARVGDRQHDVLFRDHAQIAVERFARMEVEARRARRCEGGGHLAADQPRLAHAGDDEFAAALEDHLDGLDEVLVERPFHFFERVGFGTDRLAGYRQDFVLFGLLH